MEFKILGPLEVCDEAQVLPLGGAKQRALLAILLLHANEVISVERLLEDLWGERQPTSGSKALHVYVSQLRKLVGDDRVLTRAPGYALRLDPDELDLTRFQRLREKAQTAEPHEAGTILREAISLWRGAPLADFAYESFAQADIARLEELRTSVLEQRIDVDLELGRHAELIGELETLVNDHPLREHLRAQLMLALYRSGRQAEALAVFQAGRRALVDELGIEPGRSLRELEQAILRQDAELDLDERPPLVSEPPPSPRPQPREPVAREARKTVTAVSVRVAMSSEREGHLDPETLRRMTTRAFAEIDAAAQRHGGTVEVIAGDTVSVVFGLPLVHEDDALRAMRSADEIRARLSGLGDELMSERAAHMEVRIGVSTGEVATGGPLAAQLRATGEPLMVSSQLGQAAEPGEILLDETTNRLLRDAVAVEETTVDSTASFRLVELADDLPGHVSRFSSPMVGRERERRRLQDAFDQAVGDRSCQLFTILGPAGVGKSRLVREALDALAGKALAAGGRCLPYGEGITYWPLIETIRDVASLQDTDSSEESRSKLAALLEGEEDAELIAQRVAETCGLAEYLGGAEESFSAVRTFFEALARRRPLVLVFDDIHWGEATFLDLIEHLADWTRDAPILLICLARSELLDVRARWGGGKLNATSILLEPLSEEESAKLVENLAGDALEEPTRRRIVDAAEGNPFFVEEMLALVLEDGRGAELNVPPTIQALLAARLDRLSDEERTVIEAASVEGKVFHAGSVVMRVPEGLRPSVREHLMALVRKELIRPERPLFARERAFRFRHLLIRDAAYESIPKEVRAASHERHAGWLESAAADRQPEYGEIVGYHLEQTFRYRAELGPVGDADRTIARRAAERLGAAGRRALLRADAPAALNLLSRAVSLLPPDDPARIDLVPTVRVPSLGGDLGWAVDVLDDAVSAGDGQLKAHALVQRGLLRLFTGPDVAAAELIEIAERAIEDLRGTGHDLGLARAWRLVAQANYLARRARPSVAAAERALVHARRADDPFEEREIVQYLLVALVLGPAPPLEATRLCERLREEAARNPVLEADTLGALAYFAAIQGHTAEANGFLAESRSVLEGLGDRIWPLSFYYALSAVWESDPIAIERELRPGYEALMRIGEKSALSSFATLLARAVYALGRYDEAEDLARQARDASRPIDVQSETDWRMVKAKVLARRGELHAAEELALEAVTFVEQSDFLPVHAAALMDLAEILCRAGRPREAGPAIEKALRLYEEKGNVVAVDRARAELDALGRTKPETGGRA
jgi:DNA-binding SARP family transcriptional activator/tetratricopeptide (TPR) repeat protein